MTTLLAFDTSTERMHIGLAVGARVWLHDGDGAAQASAQLIPQLLHLLSQAGIALRDVDAIAFGRGPGAFTGLRTACSVAQGLAFGAGKPVLALDSLLAVAQSARTAAGASDVWAAMDARMDEVYAAHYRHDGMRWEAAVPPALYRLEALRELWTAAPPRCIAGSALAAFGDRLAVGPAVLVAESWPDAPALLALARDAWEDDEGVDAALALPLYLRDKVALTTAEREAAKAALT